MSTTKVTRNMLDTGIADSSNATAITIDSSERVLIGTSGGVSYAHANADDFVIYKNDGEVGMTIASAADHSGNIWFSDGTSGAAQYAGWMIYNHSENRLSFGSNGSERMRLDSSGKLLIGETSNDDGAAVQIDANSSGSTVYSLRVENSNTATDVYNGIRLIQGASGSAVGVMATGGSTTGNVSYRNVFHVGTQNATSLVLGTNDTERMRIDTSGRLLVGHSAAHSDGGSQSYYSKLIVKGNTYSSNGDGRIVMQNGVASTSMANNTGIGELIYTNGSGGDHAAIKAFGDGAGADNDYPGRLSFWTTSDGGANPTERMRLTSEGRLCLGFTAKQEDAFLSIISNGSEGLFNGTAGTNRYRRYFHTASTGIHSFQGSSNTATLTNAGAWQDASDVAYKEDIQDLSYGLDAVKALRPRKYKMKGTDLGDGKGLHQSIGFIAQEIESIVPEVVDGEDGEKTLGYGQLTAVLTKAIQELSAEVEELKSKLNES